MSAAADTCQIISRGVALLARLCSTPDALEGGVDLQHLGNLDDALSGVGAFAPVVKATELIVVQPAMEYLRAQVSQ